MGRRLFTVCRWSRFTTESCLSPSALPTGTSLAAPWIIDVAGTTMTVCTRPNRALPGEHEHRVTLVR